MHRPSGMNEADTFWFGSSGFGQGFDARATQAADLALLRQLPGVADATTTNSVPMTGVRENAPNAAALLVALAMLFGLGALATRKFPARG